MFAADSVSVPVPIFSSGRAPPDSEITPDWVAASAPATFSFVVFEAMVIGVASFTALA